MRTCGLVLMVIIGLLLITHEGHAQSNLGAQQALTVNCNCASTCKLVFDLMKSSFCLPARKPKPTIDGCQRVKKNCAEVLKCGGTQNGEYSVDPDGKGAFKVYCDQTTDGGGWTVFQRREDGSVDFFRGWNDYKNGFGSLTGEFWLGLDKIHRLTNQARNRLRVELKDFKGKSAYAEYDYFAVFSERSKYKLSLGTYSGTASDSLSLHRGMAFTTKDRDNDKYATNCAVAYKGAWWYKDCYHSNLNGVYHHHPKEKPDYTGVNWKRMKPASAYYSAKRAEMKIRPV